MLMTKVMGRFDTIRHETGCDVVVIHHDSKNSTPGAQRRPRGWRRYLLPAGDWNFSITVDPEDDRRKQVFFAMKAGQAAPPVTVEFQQSQFSEAMRILPHVGAG